MLAPYVLRRPGCCLPYQRQELNRGHWAAAGLFDLVVAGEDDWSPLGRNYVLSNARALYYLRGSSEAGPFIGKGTTNTSPTLYSRTSPIDVGSDKFCTLLIARMQNSQTARTTISSIGVCCDIELGDGTNPRIAVASRNTGDAAVTQRIVAPSNYVAGKVAAVLFEHNTGVGQSLWIDGVQVGTAAITANLLSPVNSMRFFVSPGLLLGAVWKNRVFTEEEKRSLTLRDNWFSMLKPARRAIYSLGVSAGGAIDLTLANLAHAHAADALALTQAHQLALADAAHAHAADTLTLTQQHALALADALHAHAADALTLSVATDLALADVAHAHQAEAIALTQQHVLTLADALHAHTADNLTLAVGGISLTLADAAHAHAADTLTLTQQHLLVVADGVHAHGAEAIALAQTHLLALADAAHGHTADGLTLTLGGIDLVVGDAAHGHAVGALDLSQQHVLIVSDALHAQLAQTLALALPGADVTPAHVIVFRAENRILIVAQSGSRRLH